MFVSAETGGCSTAAAAALDGADPDSDDARSSGSPGAAGRRRRRVPTELAAEHGARRLARPGGVGQGAGRVGLRRVRALPRAQPRARAPLRRVLRRLRLRLRRAARRLRAGDEDRRGGATVRRAEVRAGAADRDARRARRPRRRLVLHGRVPGRPPARSWSARSCERMGFDPAGWRIDDAVHPFATSFGSADVRITTRWDETYFPIGAVRRDARVRARAVRGRDRRRRCSARRSATAESLGLHESQSRMWENMVGRGRPFCGVLAPRIAEVFGGSFAGPRAGRRSTARSTRSSRRSSASRPTRRRTACTSCCGSSSSRS